MWTAKRKSRGVVGLLIVSMFCLLILAVPHGAIAGEDFSSKVDDAVKSAQKSVDHAFQKTREYLKSEAFHQDLKRVTDGASNAVRKAGDWVGNQIDSASKTDTQKH